LKGCAEVSLNLLTPGEAVDLLMRTGEVDDVDASASAAAAEIAELCGNLPLYLSICGGVLLGYDGDPVWKTELVAMLKDDRVGVIEEGAGDRTVQCLVDSSLRMLKDEAAASAFMALGVCGEDVLVEFAAVQLIVEAGAADNAGVASGAAKTTAMRRIIKALVDRNLLQGDIASGVQMHDIVRDLVRSRMGGDDGIRVKQRAVVAALVSACPVGGWAAGDPVGQYAVLALEQHMAEALQPEPLNDTDAHVWLMHASELILTKAAAAFGSSTLQALSVAREGAGDLVGAARVAWAAQLVKGLPRATETDLIFRVADLLEMADDPSCFDFEVSVLHIAGRLDLRSARNEKCRGRWVVLAQAPGTVTSKMKIQEYWGQYMGALIKTMNMSKSWPRPISDCISELRAGHSQMRQVTITIGGEVSNLPDARGRECFFAVLVYAHVCIQTAASADMPDWNPELLGGEGALVEALMHWARAVRPGEGLGGEMALGLNLTGRGGSEKAANLADLIKAAHSALVLSLYFGNLPPLAHFVEDVCALFQERDFPGTREYKGSVMDVHYCRALAQALVLHLGRPLEACAILEAMGFVWGDDGLALYDSWFARGVMPGYIKEVDCVRHRLLLFLAAPQSAALGAEVDGWLRSSALTPSAIAQHERAQFECQALMCFEGILGLAAAAFLRLCRDDDATEAAGILVSSEHGCLQQSDLALAHGVLGQVAAKRGEAEEADGHFRRALGAAAASRFPLLEVTAARDWKQAVPASGSAADAVADTACLKMGKSRAELAPHI
jgi:hypothetical protein